MNELQAADDLQLVHHFIRGNDLAFDVLARRHRREIFETIYYIMRDRYLAEDLLQETFIRIFRSLRANGYKEKGRFLGWALTIARNLCLDHKRKLRRMPTISYRGDVFAAGAADTTNIRAHVEAKQLEQQIDHVLRLLPEEQRTVIRCRHFEEMSYKEIASAMGTSVNTTMGRMRYGLHNLGKIMKKSA